MKPSTHQLYKAGFLVNGTTEQI